MATHFILDSKLKQEKETMAEILSLTQKKEYDQKSVQLYRFVDSCFAVVGEVKQKELRKKEEALRRWREQNEAGKRKADEETRQKALEAEAPSPEMLPNLVLEAPSPETPQGNREYVLQIYHSPVGILVDKDNTGKYTYHVIEPYLDKKIPEEVYTLYGRDFEKDNSLFDNDTYMARIAEKISSRRRIPFTDMLPQQIRYYLERDILGAGPFDPLLYDERVKAIYCDGPHKPVRVDYADLGIMKTNVTIASNDILNRFLKRLATGSGTVIDTVNPILNISFQGLKFEGTMGMGGAATKLTIRRLVQ